MRLKVNGIEVRVVDRIEVVLEVPEQGDTILNGVDIHVKGGPLTVNQGDHPEAAFLFHHDGPVQFNAGSPLPFGSLVTESTASLGYKQIDVRSTEAMPPSIYRVFFDYNEAQISHGETRHAEAVMKELAANLGFTVMGSQPQTVFDGWEFWIQSPVEPKLPPYVRVVPFEPMPVGARFGNG